MATISSSYTENQSLRASATLAASGTDTNTIDLATNGYIAVQIQTDIDIGSSTGVTVEVFSSSDSGTTVDTVPIMSYTTDADEVRALFVTGYPFLSVKVTNDDGSNAVTDITQIYSGLEYVTA